MGDVMAVDHEILEALTGGIQSEIAAYVFYVEAAKVASDDNLKPALHNLALEEKKHFQVLEGKYDSLVRSEKWISTADILNKEGLPEIDAKMTAKHQDLITKVQNIKSDREILNMALVLEEDAKALFERLARTAKSEKAVETFNQLARFEDGHAQLIRDMLAALKD